MTDKLDHPVALLSLREVSRDEAGSLLDLKDWTWWGLELVRRALRDWWIDGRRGTGAEGVVLIIDVAGAGYRNMVSPFPSIRRQLKNIGPSVRGIPHIVGNRGIYGTGRTVARTCSPSETPRIDEAPGTANCPNTPPILTKTKVDTIQEVELLPTLFSVGHNNFPGQIESVYIVNAGWSQLAMWNTVVKRVLPRSALDKVIFLQNREQTQTVFDLDSLPKGEQCTGITHAATNL